MMIRQPLYKIIVLAAGGLVGMGCGQQGEETRTGQGRDDMTLEALGRCDEGATPGDPRPSARGLVAATAEWLQVDIAASDLDVAAAQDGTVDRPLWVAPVSRIGNTPSTIRPANERTVRMHDSFLDGLEWVAANPGAKAYLALGDEPNYMSQVLFGVVVAADGRVAFTGSCARETILRPLAAAGGDVDEMVRSWVGLTGPDLTMATGTTAGLQPVDPPVILAPSQVYDPNASGGTALGQMPPDMTLVGVNIDVPADWAAPATVCTKAPQGWNDCLPLDGSLRLPSVVTAFVDDSGVLEVWLLDENALVTDPRQLLGTITVPEPVRATGGTVNVTLSGSLRVDGTRVDTVGLVQH